MLIKLKLANNFFSRWKWSLKQPIIAGRKRRSTTSDAKFDEQSFNELLEKAYTGILEKLEQRETKNEKDKSYWIEDE